MLYIIKKDRTLEAFNPEKIITAVSKSADRVGVTLTERNKKDIIHYVKSGIEESELEHIPISKMHNFVECALDNVNPNVAKSYREYRNYKEDFINRFDSVYKFAQATIFLGDNKDNANTDAALVSTKRSLIYQHLNKELYQKFFLRVDELQACRDGYIYVHDMGARRDTFNCCLFDVANVLKGGFEMGNIWYNEPQSIETAFSIISDLVPNVASNQYGGITLPELDKVLEPYCEKSIELYRKEIIQSLNCLGFDEDSIDSNQECTIYDLCIKRLYESLLKGFQGFEYKFNTVGSSRGDYPFIATTFGLGKSNICKLINKAILETRKNGQGKKGYKKPVLFPKLIFLYDEELHGEGKELEEVFDTAIECSKKAMYPDFLSMSGDGYVPSMYKKYGAIVSPMGCRAFLSPWYEKGGIYPEDENDVPVFVGRHNLGVVSLNLPLIYHKATQECKDFFEVLDYYLEMIRTIHTRTYDYLGELRASCNPVMYCEGGLYGGNLKPNEKIKPLLKSATMVFGITALNELQELYNKKSLVEDGEFALEVMEYINKKVTEFKEADGKLYAIYGTPAESLSTLQATQLKKQMGIIENVSDFEYLTNSFHCSVREDITPIEKQDLENRFWNYFNGGKIQYVRYPVNYNTEAIKTLVRRAMSLGFYEGINMALSFCEKCGHQQLEMDECPKCGSTDITQIDRVCGYLGYTRVKGDTRVNTGKYAEIKDRVSM